MSIKVIFNHILIEPVTTDTEFLTATNGMMTSKSKVIAIGDECKLIKVGDTIIANYWAPDEIEVDGKKLFFVQENPESIKAIIE